MPEEFVELEAAIANRLNDNWSTTPIIYENTDAEPPSDGSAFVVLLIQPLSETQVSVGNVTEGDVLFRITGTILVQVFTPVGDGSGLGMQYASEIAKVFRARSFNNVVVRNGFPRKDGRQQFKSGNYFRTTLNMPFYYDRRY